MITFLSGKANLPVDVAPVNLGQAGIAFMRSKLDRGRPLSSATVKSFGAKGVSFSLLPAGTTIEQATQFDTSVQLPMRASYPWLADYISAHWGGRGYALVFEDPWMEPSDFAIRPPNQPHFTSNGIMYYMPQGNTALAALDAGATAVRSWLKLGFVISPSETLPSSGTEVDANLIKMLAQNVQAVFASAYDQESWVIWQR